ncbi:MAG: hypothetical protein N3A54_01745 [Patescibacteria group bacterium]|nr:hypothetical protein [Patescibacteria group bacterium]
MTEETLEKIARYSIGGDNLVLSEEEYKTVIDFYLQDKNSSSLREIITLMVADVTPYYRKTFYDGFDKFGNYYEVKCMSVDDTSKKKLNGGGSYNDMTWFRHDKYKKDNPYILISGFIKGKLIYIFQTKYESFVPFIDEKIFSSLGKRTDEQKAMNYLRSIKFCYTQWKDFDNLETIYITNEDSFLTKKYIVKDFLDFLYEKRDQDKL